MPPRHIRRLRHAQIRLKIWPEPRKTRDELLAAVPKTVGEMPGNNYEFSQPIQLQLPMG